MISLRSTAPVRWQHPAGVGRPSFCIQEVISALSRNLKPRYEGSLELGGLHTDTNASTW